ncbi:hypothetical protein ACLOJK_015615 [Asimina triloba]
MRGDVLSRRAMNGYSLAFLRPWRYVVDVFPLLGSMLNTCGNHLHVKWSTIASQLPGRTDNEIKNFWNTHLKKRLFRMGLDPAAHVSGPTAASSAASPTTRHMAQWESARLEAEARLSRESLLFISSQPEPLASMPGKSDADHFLRMWNSEVGESFRRLHGQELATSCDSPISPASSSTAMAAATVTASTITSDRCGSDEVETGVLVKSELSSSNEEEEELEEDDLQDTSLNLLLDLPADEMGFFQGQISNFPFSSD